MIWNNYFDYKRGWKIMNNEYPELIDLFSEVLGYAEELGILPTSNIYNTGFYLRKTTRAIAACHWHKYSNGMVDIAFTFNEEVVKKIPIEKLREVVIHEVAHACSIGDGHGNLWKRMYCKLGARWGYNNPSRLSQNTEINAVMSECKEVRTKYLVRCPACGATWKYTRASACVQHPQTFRCGCGWKGLEVINL